MQLGKRKEEVALAMPKVWPLLMSSRCLWDQQHAHEADPTACPHPIPCPHVCHACSPHNHAYTHASAAPTAPSLGSIMGHHDHRPGIQGGYVFWYHSRLAGTLMHARLVLF